MVEYQPKYRTTFEAKAFFQKGDFPEKSFVSKASVGLDNLATLLPNSKEILDNPDLLYACFNVAVANLVNLNDDAITTAGAKNLAASCKNKPGNIEHDRYGVIGFVTNYGFSSFGNNKLLTLEELTDDPFNISLAAIVWKVCNRDFARFLEESQDKDSPYFQAISTSWEVGFDSYKLVVGSKNLTKAKIIEDEKEIEEYSKYLNCMGGTGFLPSGEEVYRVVGDDCRFLGFAFTTNPAAAVSGVKVVDYRDIEEEKEEEDEEEEEEEEEDESESSVSEVAVIKSITTNFVPPEESNASQSLDNQEINFEKINNKISPINKKRVIIRMKYNNVDELVDNLQEAHASDVRDFISSQIEKSNEKFLELKNEKEAKEQALNDALATVKEFEKQSEELKNEVAQLRASIKAQEDAQKFQERMASLKEEYELDDKASKSIAKRISGLSDEQFAEWLEDMQPLLKKKSEQEQSLASAEPINAPIPNATSKEVSKYDEWRQVLASVTVTK